MKYFSTLALLTYALLASVPLFAQNKEYPNAITAKLNFLDYGLFYNKEPHLSQGFEVGFFRNVHQYLNLGLPVKVGLSKLPPAFGKNMVTFSADLVAQVANTNTRSKFLPFGILGVGIAKDDVSGTFLQVPVGVGCQYKISKYAAVTVQGELRKVLIDNNRDNFQVGVGFVYLLHKPDLRDMDADKDGTPDAIDKCPTEAGPATALGCPDTDKDGVANKEDKCPTEPGPLETNGCPDADSDGYPDATDKCPDIAGILDGCPDTDKDGFADDIDECPTEPGRWNGCPDTDLDGIADKDDKCPTEAGSAEHNGCPDKMMPKDTDGDGFDDENDLCPDLAGLLDGCPDTDGDGIVDKNDKCPNEAGTAAENGCPAKIVATDSDNDGFADADDACPFLAGTAKGCPDADGDGIADKDDKCPNQSGSVSNKGCPEVKDADGDGFEDEKDACPYQAGSANGCPDGDGDGIADKDDPCPNAKGSLNGCPDTDNDGVADKNDPCPLVAGTLNGCPDTDGDGIADKDDKCPNTPGVPENNGCPKVVDTDKDGFADAEDQCPDQAGTLKGCPDADGDGVADKDDPCPKEKGTLKGCPDRDADGVADKDDPCPDKAGSFGGCPDSDGDGVADNKDKCPNLAARTADGCPEKPTARDSDGDGVDDSIDKCPNTPGLAANSGCPEIRKETKERLAFAMQAVQFETGKARLKAESFDILDEIVGILRQYPDYKLAIGGHTDNVGDDEINLKLSSERAKTCYDYLIFKGINVARLRFAGFGELRPIADNSSAAGREMNRRVEFELTLD